MVHENQPRPVRHLSFATGPVEQRNVVRRTTNCSLRPCLTTSVTGHNYERRQAENDICEQYDTPTTSSARSPYVPKRNENLTRESRYFERAALPKQREYRQFGHLGERIALTNGDTYAGSTSDNTSSDNDSFDDNLSDATAYRPINGHDEIRRYAAPLLEMPTPSNSRPNYVDERSEYMRTTNRFCNQMSPTDDEATHRFPEYTSAPIPSYCNAPSDDSEDSEDCDNTRGSISSSSGRYFDRVESTSPTRTRTRPERLSQWKLRTFGRNQSVDPLNPQETYRRYDDVEVELGTSSVADDGDEIELEASPEDAQQHPNIAPSPVSDHLSKLNIPQAIDDESRSHSSTASMDRLSDNIEPPHGDIEYDMKPASASSERALAVHQKIPTTYKRYKKTSNFPNPATGSQYNGRVNTAPQTNNMSRHDIYDGNRVLQTTAVRDMVNRQIHQHREMFSNNTRSRNMRETYPRSNVNCANSVFPSLGRVNNESSVQRKRRYLPPDQAAASFSPSIALSSSWFSVSPHHLSQCVSISNLSPSSSSSCSSTSCDHSECGPAECCTPTNRRCIGNDDDFTVCHRRIYKNNLCNQRDTNVCNVQRCRYMSHPPTHCRRYN